MRSQVYQHCASILVAALRTTCAWSRLLHKTRSRVLSLSQTYTTTIHQHLFGPTGHATTTTTYNNGPLKRTNEAKQKQNKKQTYTTTITYLVQPATQQQQQQQKQRLNNVLTGAGRSSSFYLFGPTGHPLCAIAWGVLSIDV